MDFLTFPIIPPLNYSSIYYCFCCSRKYPVHLPLIFKLVIEFQDDNLCLKKGNLDLDYMTNIFRITKNYYTCSRKKRYLQSKAPCLKFEDLLIQSMQKKNPFQRIFMIFPFSKCLCLIFDQFCCITDIKWVYRHRS